MTGCDFDRELLLVEVRTILARQATPAWKATTIVDWLIEHRVVLCAHSAPGWQCDVDCPAYQALQSRLEGALRQLEQGDPE